MGTLLGFLAGLVVLGIVCRLLVSAFPVLRTIIQILIWVVAIVVGFASGFWWGVLAFFCAAIISVVFFGVDFDDESDPKTYRKKSFRPKSGLKCQNCGSTNTYKLDDQETEKLYWSQYRANNYGGTMKDAYKCQDCGHHMWYDSDGQFYYTHPN